jgi:DNA-directed RNA polymerase subunit RPC12/RpoP
MSPLADVIVCVECGGTAHLLTVFAPDDGPRPGDVVAYRCSECLDRFDLVVDEADMEDDPGQ